MSDEPKERSLWTSRIDIASVAHKFLRFSFGMPGLAYSGGLLSFVAGLGLTDAALDAIWPQWDSVDGIRLAGGVGVDGVRLAGGVGGIRLAGGVAGPVIFLSAIKWRNRLSWPQVLVAISLFPVIFLVWFCIFRALFGIYGIVDPRPDPGLDLRLAVFLTIAFVAPSGYWAVDFGLGGSTAPKFPRLSPKTGFKRGGYFGIGRSLGMR